MKEPMKKQKTNNWSDVIMKKQIKALDCTIDDNEIEKLEKEIINLKKDRHNSFIYICTLTIVVLIMAFLYIGTPVKIESFNCTSNYTQGIQDTLKNETLMSEVTNEINLYAIGKYGSPIVYYNGKIYAFRNITEVRLK